MRASPESREYKTGMGICGTRALVSFLKQTDINPNPKLDRKQYFYDTLPVLAGPLTGFSWPARRFNLFQLIWGQLLGQSLKLKFQFDCPTGSTLSRPSIGVP